MRDTSLYYYLHFTYECWLLIVTYECDLCIRRQMLRGKANNISCYIYNRLSPPEDHNSPTLLFITVLLRIIKKANKLALQLHEQQDVVKEIALKRTQLWSCNHLYRIVLYRTGDCHSVMDILFISIYAWCETKAHAEQGTRGLYSGSGKELHLI